MAVVFVTLLLSLRRIGRLLISNWLLIVVFCCIIAYLVYPNPLATLSYVLWPTQEKGPLTQTGIVQFSYNISGSTTFPGIINLNIRVTNKDSTAHEFVILAVIGSPTNRVWYGPGYYRDYLSPATSGRARCFSHPVKCPIVLLSL